MSGSTYGLGRYGQGEYGRYDPDPVAPGIQTPRAPADARVRAYDPNGETLGLLPTPTEVSVQFALNDVGALSVDYPLAGPRASLLGRPLELALEVTWDGGETWNEPPSARFQYLRDEADGTKPQEGFKVTALGYVKRLEKALVGQAGLDDQGRRTYEQVTPGGILADLWDLAQARGLLVGMTRTWTASTDTNGTPWPELQSIGYDPGANLLAVLQGMADQGWLDFRTMGRSVQVYVADSQDGMGQDQTLGALPVTLRYGRDLTEAPFRRTWEGLADTILVQGDGGAFTTRTNPSAITPWGRQETFATASGVTDEGTLAAIGDATLSFTEKERVEHTLGLEFATTPHLPFRDYLPGHWVYASTDSNVEPVRMRLRAVTITRDSQGNLGGNVTLNDKFLEGDILQNRRITKLTQGAVQAGTGGTPSGIGNDILAPAKAATPAGSSTAYVDADGRIKAQITLNWTDTTTNADGSPANDVDHYEVWARVPGQGDWSQVAVTNVSEWTNSPYEPGVTWEFMVRAVDTVYNRGAFSNTRTVTTQFDMTPPPKPSAPTGTTRMGTAQIAWDGKTATGTDMAATVLDFRYVDVHVGTVNGFTPSDATRVGELSGPGYVVAGPLSYQATYYTRLVAYDSSGNASAVSDQAVLVVAPLVDVSNFPDDAMAELYARTGHFLTLTSDNFQANLIEGSWIKAGAITADKLTISSRGQSVLVNSFMEDTNPDGTPTSWVTIFGTAGTTLAAETAAPLSGARSLRVSTTGTAAITVASPESEIPVVAGQVWYGRLVVRATVATSRQARIIAHTANPVGNLLGLNSANTTWHDMGALANGAPWVAGQTRTLEGSFTVPANHVKATVVFRTEAGGASGDTFVVDGIEMWPATTDSQVTDIGAGKIKTGVLQATERIVAGTLTGARAELNGVGFQAFNPSGIKMFEVQANSGDTYIGDTSGIYIKMGAYANIWNSGISQAVIRFGNAPAAGWADGQIHSQYFGEGGTNWAALRLTSPYEATAGFPNAPFLDLRQNNLAQSKFYLKAQEANFTANTFIVGDGTSTTDFRSLGTGFQFSDFSQTSRLRMIPGLGQFTLRAAGSDGNVQVARIQASQVAIEVAGQDLNAVSTGTLAWANFNKNIGLGFNNNSLIVGTYMMDLFQPIAASAFNVNSDPRVKSNAKPVTGALKAVRALRVYDYDMEGILPRKSLKAPRTVQVEAPDGARPRPGAEQVTREANRARGVMADEVRTILPDAVNEDEQGRLTVSLYDLLATTMAGLRELADEVDTLKATQSPKK